MDELLNTAPCGFLAFDDDGTILVVNSTLLGWLGYREGELIGRHVECLEAEEANRVKDALIEELSTPVITVWDGVLLGPVIGSLSRERADLMTGALLRAVVERRARVVILDVTGVRAMDEDVIRHLSRAAAAVRLMGAECMLTGIGAGVARTLVRVGADLSGVELRRTLADALVFAMRASGAGRQQLNARGASPEGR